MSEEIIKDAAPVADAPIADAPVTDVPVADAPVGDSLISDTHTGEIVPDAPEPDAPVADAPKSFDEDWMMGKYETKEDLAEGYKNLESKLGGFTGSPEEYSFEFNEDLGEVDFDKDSDAYQDVTKMMSEGNMNNDMANELMNYHFKEMKKLEASYRPDTEAEIESIDNFKERATSIAQFGKNNLDAGELKVLESLIATKAEMQLFEKLIGMVNKVPSVMGKESPQRDTSITQEDLMAMQSDPELEKSPTKQRAMKAAYAKKYGTT